MYERSLTEESLYADYGPKVENIELGRQVRQALLDDYLSLYETAEPRQPCRWTFYPAAHYLPDSDSIPESEARAMEINAIAECPDGRIYAYQVRNRKAEDLCEHRILAYLDSPLDIGLMREPAADDMEAVRHKAETLLSEIGPGQFTVDRICTVQYDSSHGIHGYAVSVSAVPVYSGWPALHQTRAAGVRSAGDSIYAPTYGPQRVGFHFTADGLLLDFQYESPLALVETSEEAPVIDWEEARERIEQRFYLAREPFSVKVDVNIDEIVFGLARVYLEGNATDFQLVPALLLRGHRVIYDEEGNIDYTAGLPKTWRWYASDGREGYENDLLTVSLIDGSVLVQNAYSALDIDLRF